RSVELSSEGLDGVARLLRVFFSRTLRIAFENYGMVGEFAGDRVMITFGFPRQVFTSQIGGGAASALALNVERAVNTAFAIQRLTEEIRADRSIFTGLRQFEVGIGICAGRPAWIGDVSTTQQPDLEDAWRQELTVISTAVNIASRAE